MANELLDKGLRLWILKTARENQWRVAGWYELDDLIQDGFVCYCKCRNRYAFLDTGNPTEEQRRWFMALVKTTFIRHITDLANDRTALEPEVAWSSLSDGDERQALQYADNFVGQPSALLLLLQAPDDLRKLVTLLLEDGLRYLANKRVEKEVGPGQPRLIKLRHPLRETTNEYYCRLMGLDPEQANVVEQLENYLSGCTAAAY